VARQSRDERRARRQAAHEPALAGAGGPSSSEPPVRLAPEPPARPEQTERRGTGLINFLRECIAELRKVDWPKQNQVIQGTVVVIVACTIVGTYLYVCDRLFAKLVQQVFLR
jgi:preprotein translocase subunit SecE